MEYPLPTPELIISDGDGKLCIWMQTRRQCGVARTLFTMASARCTARLRPDTTFVLVGGGHVRKRGSRGFLDKTFGFWEPKIASLSLAM